MGGEDQTSTADSSCPRAPDLRRATPHTAPKTGAKRSDSNLSGLPCLIVRKRFVHQPVQFSALRVGPDLPIPHDVVELDKPRAELRQFLGREIADSLFEFFQL